jgi:hypothetical protein
MNVDLIGIPLCLAAFGLVTGGEMRPQTSGPSSSLTPIVYDDPRVAAAAFEKHPDALKATIRSMEAKGLRPTATVHRFLTPPVVRAQYFGDWSGEMVVWDWDDGNPNTIEGTVLIRSYQNGETMVFNLVAEIAPWGEVWVHWAQPTGVWLGDGTYSPVQWNCNPSPSRTVVRMSACLARDFGGRARNALNSAGMGVLIRTVAGMSGGGLTLGAAFTLAVQGAGWGWLGGFYNQMWQGGPADCSERTIEAELCVECQQRGTCGEG